MIKSNNIFNVFVIGIGLLGAGFVQGMNKEIPAAEIFAEVLELFKVKTQRSFDLYNTPRNYERYRYVSLEDREKNTQQAQEAEYFNLSHHDNIRNEANLQLLKAAKCGDVTEVKRLIKEGIADINTTNSNKNTPLMLAIIYGPRYAYYSVDTNVNLFSQNSLCDHIGIAQTLIAANADLNSKNVYGKPALVYAVKRNNITLIKDLISAQAEVEPAFDYAIRCNDTNIINILLSAQAEIPIAYKIKLLELAIDSSDKNLPFQIINPGQKSRARKNIETLLVVYNRQGSNISELPKELLKIIVTYAYPEYAIDMKTLQLIDPAILVDRVPIETLKTLVKNDILQHNPILIAWQNKLMNIAQELTQLGKLNDNDIQNFLNKSLKIIAESFD